jgi:hypothetical protein
MEANKRKKIGWILLWVLGTVFLLGSAGCKKKSTQTGQAGFPSSTTGQTTFTNPDDAATKTFGSLSVASDNIITARASQSEMITGRMITGRVITARIITGRIITARSPKFLNVSESDNDDNEDDILNLFGRLKKSRLSKKQSEEFEISCEDLKPKCVEGKVEKADCNQSTNRLNFDIKVSDCKEVVDEQKGEYIVSTGYAKGYLEISTKVSQNISDARFIVAIEDGDSLVKEFIGNKETKRVKAKVSNFRTEITGRFIEGEKDVDFRVVRKLSGSYSREDEIGNRKEAYSYNDYVVELTGKSPKSGGEATFHMSIAGGYSVDTEPASCVEGTFNFKTIKPVKSSGQGYCGAESGEIEVNNAKVEFSSGKVKVSLDNQQKEYRCEELGGQCKYEPITIAEGIKLGGEEQKGACPIWYKDLDGDGYTDGGVQISCEQPTGYVSSALPGDCNDNDKNLNPNTIWFKDSDKDGYTDGTTQVSCAKPSDEYLLSAKSGDCNDNNPNISPGRTETCDSLDNNCNGQTDEGFNVGQGCTVGVGECARTGQFVCKADGSGTVCSAVPGNPAPEICDGKDNNCNGQIDDGFNVGQACSVGVGECLRMGLYVCKADGSGTQCNATPGTPTAEVCDGKDNNCDGQIDEGLLLTFYRDQDGDGFGDPNNFVKACTQPAGYVSNSSDCNDNDPTTMSCMPSRCRVILDENFDSYTTGTFPPTWQLVFSGAGASEQIVTNVTSVSPPNSFRLRGMPGWSATAQYVLPETAPIIWFEGMVMSSEAGGDGQTIGLWNRDEHAWGVYYCTVVFMSDGRITLYPTEYTLVSSYVPGKWYKIRVRYNAVATTADVWIDDTLIVQNFFLGTPIYATSQGYKALELVSGHGGKAFYYDNIKVCIETAQRSKPRMGVDVAYSNFYPYGSITNVSGGTLNLKWSIPNVKEWLIATGDINGDGKVEIVAVDAVNKRLKAISYSGTILWDIAIPSASYVVPPFLENVQGDSSPEILVGYRDTSNNLKVNVYDGNGNLIKTLNAGVGGWDSICAPFMVKGDTVFLWCQAGYSCSPRGLKALSYSGANVIWENISGNSLGGDPYSVADIDNDGVLDISIPSFTPHNGCSGGGINDGVLWSIVIKENGVTRFATNLASLQGLPDLNGAYSQKLTDLDGDGNPEIIGFEWHDPTFYTGINKIHIINSTGTAIVRTWNGPSNGDRWHSSIVDLNGDGRKEIVASAWAIEGLYILSYDLSTILYTSPGGGILLGTNDIDGDGEIEIIVLQRSTNKIRVLNRDLTEQWSYTLPVAQVRWADETFAISDLDGNGINEIIIAPGVSTMDNLYVFEPSGGGGPAPSIREKSSFENGKQTRYGCSSANIVFYMLHLIFPAFILFALLKKKRFVKS